MQQARVNSRGQVCHGSTSPPAVQMLRAPADAAPPNPIPITTPALHACCTPESSEPAVPSASLPPAADRGAALPVACPDATPICAIACTVALSETCGVERAVWATRDASTRADSARTASISGSWVCKRCPKLYLKLKIQKLISSRDHDILSCKK